LEHDLLVNNIRIWIFLILFARKFCILQKKFSKLLQIIKFIVRLFINSASLYFILFLHFYLNVLLEIHIKFFYSISLSFTFLLIFERFSIKSMVSDCFIKIIFSSYYSNGSFIENCFTRRRRYLFLKVIFSIHPYEIIKMR
jgi:hypothetical protein